MSLQARFHMISFTRTVISAAALLAVLSGCGDAKQDALFELLPSSSTHITFNNAITESDSFNVLTFEYIYNGAGVGVGDVNNDGLTDIFFAGNMVPGKLYLNRGGFVFDDITEKANTGTDTWCTGVAIADVNQDGLLDIYVSTIQPDLDKPGTTNLLFINKGNNAEGIPVFEEVAARMGLADSSYSTQAAFLDYDNDGDLDMYLLNNAMESYNRNLPLGQRFDGTGKSTDKLFRNDGKAPDSLPHFTDVSAEAGILTEGWGLGIVVNDINNDGYPDIYTANDFASNDLLYVNNGNGTFTNRINTMLKHQEHNGMGIDIADINNDGLNDIVALDMLPDDNLRQKTMFTTIGYDKFMLFRKKGYQDQYIRNVLQLNNGNNTFSDIGYLAGIYATDWSWSSLLADFDNDGYRDLFVGNGYRKDVTDQDFIVYSKELSMFSRDKDRRKIIRQEVEKLPGVKKPNFLFKNNGDLTFSDKAAEWGLDQPSYSNGAAYADFDNDGDLDLVTNNINDEAFIYRNKTIDAGKQGNSFLRMRLTREASNLQAYGTKIKVYTGQLTYYAEHQTQRGYKSTVEDIEHFGLGKVASGKADSVVITWPGGKTQVLKNVSLNQTITVVEKDAVMRTPIQKHVMPAFEAVQEALNIRLKHDEEEFVDFLEAQFLVPHKHSQNGPGITVGDVNGDGLDDFIVGGAARKGGYLGLQQKDGAFITSTLPVKEPEDMGLLLFDADTDGDLDLYCTSGSSEFKSDVAQYQHRLYRNDGKGNFTFDKAALPAITASGGCVVASDFDHDGDLDLFAGGRLVPTHYPEAPESYLLVNDGKGNFKNGTALLAPALAKTGMVTSALWTDINNDGWQDLALVGEWMPVTFFVSQQGRSFTTQTLDASSGWWNSLAGGDFDNDGDTDYIAGNLGLNSIYKASVEEPVSICAKDFDGNGSVDPILCRYIQGKEYPAPPRDALIGQVPALKGVAIRYAKYGSMGITDLLSEQRRKDALVLKSTLMASVYIENTGGHFTLKTLPAEAQFAPLYGIAVTDVNEDGNLDVLAAGNSYAAEPLSGLYDASIGNYLQGDGKGNFKNVPVTTSGFFVDGDAKGLACLTRPNGSELFIVTQNRDSVKVFTRTLNNDSREVIRAKPLETSAMIQLKNGKQRKTEFYWGSGYLSSSSRMLIKSKDIATIKMSSVSTTRNP
jgi:enediyne biosynthesis protein E4